MSEMAMKLTLKIATKPNNLVHWCKLFELIFKVGTREMVLKIPSSTCLLQEKCLVVGRPPAQGLQLVSCETETTTTRPASHDNTLATQDCLLMRFFVLLLFCFNLFNCLMVSCFYIINSSHFHHSLFSHTGIFLLSSYSRVFFLCVVHRVFKRTYPSVRRRCFSESRAVWLRLHH